MPIFFCPHTVLLILEVMAQPTSVTLDDEGGEEVGTSKPANKKSEYGKVLAVCSSFLPLLTLFFG